MKQLQGKTPEMVQQHLSMLRLGPAETWGLKASNSSGSVLSVTRVETPKSMKNLPTPREKSLDQANLEEDDAWPKVWVNNLTI